MWLPYGVDAYQALVCIADVRRGKTALRCPYCAGPLTAKKGQITQHHFARYPRRGERTVGHITCLTVLN